MTEPTYRELCERAEALSHINSQEAKDEYEELCDRLISMDMAMGGMRRDMGKKQKPKSDPPQSSPE